MHQISISIVINFSSDFKFKYLRLFIELNFHPYTHPYISAYIEQLT
jgi:hypothetical protein